MKTSRAPRLCPLLFLAVACGEAPIEPGDPVPPPSSEQQDPDGDGLPSAVENEGWIIDVDSRGYGLDVVDRLETRRVTSDPTAADTDGDGLSDSEEQAANTDPRSTDTDGDGLTDFEELRIYKSSPLSKDSDGDARMMEDGERVGVPNASLFDGEEVRTLLTSPLDPDSDGDGLTDFEEVTFGRAARALIADVPDIRIDVYGNPSISYSGTIINAEGQQEEVGKTFTEGSSFSASTGRTDTRSSSTVINESRTAGASLEVTYPWGGSVEGHYESSYSKTSSFGMESTATFDQTRAQEMSTELATVLGRSSNREVIYTGGTVQITFDLSNVGQMPIVLKDIEIAALQFDGVDRSQLVPVGLLTPTGTGQWSLGVNASSLSNVASVELDSPSAIETLLSNRQGMFFRVSKYALSDAATGKDYVVQDSLVERRTGRLVIDYGALGAGAESFRIATNVRRDPQTNRPLGVDLATVLGPKMLDRAFETEISADGVQVLTALELTSRSNRFARITDREADGFWVVIGDGGRVQRNIDFTDLVLNQGEQISLVFVRDQDQDGLFYREEQLLGTLDTQADTDGDGLTDFEEARTGWGIAIYDDGYIAYSDPRIVDSDDDGLTDAEEKALGTDPQDPNTDNDAYPDAVDPAPLEPESYSIVDVYMWAGRRLRFSDIRVNGGSAREVTVTPGASFTLSLDWRLDVDNADIYCPGCIVQFYMGLENTNGQCYTSRQMRPGTTASGVVNATFTAPTEPGTYFVNNTLTLEYSCVNKVVSRDPNNAIAVVHVR